MIQDKKLGLKGRSTIWKGIFAGIGPKIAGIAGKTDSIVGKTDGIAEKMLASSKEIGANTEVRFPAMEIEPGVAKSCAEASSSAFLAEKRQSGSRGCRFCLS